MLLAGALVMALSAPALDTPQWRPVLTAEAIQRAVDRWPDVPAAPALSLAPQKRDSLLNGILVGFAAGMAYGALICALGWSGEHDPCGAAILGPAVAGAAVGGLIDYRKDARAPAGPSGGRRLAVAWPIRF